MFDDNDIYLSYLLFLLLLFEKIFNFINEIKSQT